MEFEIIEGYYTVTLTKRLQLCKTKQFFKKIWWHKDKIDKFFNSVFDF